MSAANRAIQQAFDWASASLSGLGFGAEQEQAVECETLRPSILPKNFLVEFIAGTFGATVEIFDLIQFDAFYEHMRLLERDSRSDDAPIARYSGYAHFVGLGARLHFDPNPQHEPPGP